MPAAEPVVSALEGILRLRTETPLDAPIVFLNYNMLAFDEGKSQIGQP